MMSFRSRLSVMSAVTALAVLPLASVHAQTPAPAPLATPAAAPAPTAKPAVVRKTLARVSMLSANPEAMKRFYVDALGFQPVWEGQIGEGAIADTISKAWRLPPGARLNGALMKAPRGDMELQVTYIKGQRMARLPRQRNVPAMSGDHYFVIHVPDLDAVVEKMKPFNISYNRPPMRMTAVNQQGETLAVYEAVVYDPEGTLLILVEDY